MGLKRLFWQTGLYSQALHLPTLVLEVASRSPSQYPCFSITLLSTAVALGRYMVMGKGEESTGGREGDTELGACYEALLGAVFLEFGYEQASKLVMESLIKLGS